MGSVLCHVVSEQFAGVRTGRPERLYTSNTIEYSIVPVEFDTYEEGAGRMDLSEGSNARAILSFLAEHPDQGFTPTEIHESIGIAYGSVGPTLARLEERGLVRHKAPYWSIGHGDHLATYAGMRSTTEAIEERFGPEDPDDWLENAEPVDDG